MSKSLFSSAAIILLAGAVTCPAQTITSARSGTLHYFQGDVSIDGAQVQAQKGTFAQVKENSTLRTGLGRAEVLLTPGVFLRVGENSSVKMLDTRLAATRVELLAGSAMIESEDPGMSVKNAPVTILYKDYQIRPEKHGLFEISTDPAQMKVYQGEAEVFAGSEAEADHVVVKVGHLLPFSGALVAEKFADKLGDDLYVWTRERSGALSAANVASAQHLSNGFNSNSPYAGGWYFNQGYSMFTYMPADGVLWNPWGYGFYSPYAVNYYIPAGGYYRPGTTLSSASAGLSAPVRGNVGLNNNAIARNGGAPSVGSPIRGGGFSGGMAPPSAGGNLSGARAPVGGGGGFSAPAAGGGGGGGFSPAAVGGGGGGAPAARGR